MEVRALLDRCRHAQEELTVIWRQIERLNNQRDGGRAIRYRELLLKREQETIDDLAALERLVGSLSDPRARTVLRYYYSMGFSDLQISETMKLTDEWVRKKRYSAVRELEAALPGALQTAVDTREA